MLKVRSKEFSRVWSVVQGVQAVPCLVGISLTGWDLFARQQSGTSKEKVLALTSTSTSKPTWTSTCTGTSTAKEERLDIGSHCSPWWLRELSSILFHLRNRSLAILISSVVHQPTISTMNRCQLILLPQNVRFKLFVQNDCLRAVNLQVTHQCSHPPAHLPQLNPHTKVF